MSLGRALKVFLIVVVVWGAGDFVLRGLLHFDCIGPDFPGVGCVSDPYPSASATGAGLSFELLRLLVIGALIFGLVYFLGDLFLRWGGVLLRRLFPGWLEEYEDRQRTTRYRLR